MIENRKLDGEETYFEVFGTVMFRNFERAELLKRILDSIKFY